MNSCLSRRLERIPFLSDGLTADIMPQMHLQPDVDVGADAPDLFTERVLQAQLAQFWRSHSASKGSEYDAIGAGERYEIFCSTFLPKMPPVFALQPDKRWDDRLPTLPMQRQLLHMAIFNFICWNFSPAVLQQPNQVEDLLSYRKILTAHNKKVLAVAALRLLESVSTLHTMMGGSHTRYAGIIVPIFESAVPLLCLCADEDFPGDAGDSGSHTLKTDPLGFGMSKISRAVCMQAAWESLNRLQTLAAVSDVAEVGARTLNRLMDKVNSSSSPTWGFQCLNKEADAVLQLSDTSETWRDHQTRDYHKGIHPAQSLLDSSQGTNAPWSWEEMLGDLESTFGVEGVEFLHNETAYP